MPREQISSRSFFDFEGKSHRLREIEAMISQKNFWDDPENAKPVLKERTHIMGILDAWNGLNTEITDCDELLDMALEEDDTSAISDVLSQVSEMETRLHKFYLSLMLDDPDDNSNAIISINAGAGGTDSQDWAEILFRMYSRWVERKGFKKSLIDYQPGDEAGIKSVTFMASGDNAFGYLKAETGVHRLVRISPFNAAGKRHTSFASVFVYPELNQEIVVDVDEKDLRVDVFRASGAGGQHVNKTSSAIRITHLPTGIVVQCQQESSQHRNREIALSVLKSRLYQHEKQKQDAKLQAMHDGKDDIAWGSQIRSYVMHPYQLVKDHRISLEVGNVQAVLDGDLDPFIEGVLLAKATK